MSNVYSRFELSKENHLRYWFNDDTEQLFRQNDHELAHMSLGGISTCSSTTFLESLIKTAKTIGSRHNGQLHLFLSGGLDSEVAFRAFQLAGISFQTVVIRFVDDLNVEDVQSAMDLCSKASVKPMIIDFDPNLFFISNDWKRIAVTYQSHTFYQQLLIGIAEQLAAPMLTVDEIEIVRNLDNTWSFIKKEDQDGCWHRFVDKTNIPAYNNFYTYDPTSMQRFLSNQTIQSLISNQIYGKLSWVSSKQQIYTELTGWSFSKRPKRHGLERLMHIWDYVENATSLLLPGSPRIFHYSAQCLATKLSTKDALSCHII